MCFHKLLDELQNVRVFVYCTCYLCLNLLLFQNLKAEKTDHNSEDLDMEIVDTSDFMTCFVLFHKFTKEVCFSKIGHLYILGLLDILMTSFVGIDRKVSLYCSWRRCFFTSLALCTVSLSFWSSLQME